MTLLPRFLTDFSIQIPDPMGLGQEAVDFISGLLLEGNQPFDLHPVQERILRYVFGNVDSDGFRLVDTLFLYVPSGQAKSTLAAAIAVMMLSHKSFRIDEGQLVVAAMTKDQASKTCFGMALKFIEREFTKPQYADEPGALEKRFKIVNNAVERCITHIPSGSTLRVLTKEGASQEGLSVYLFVAEEIHVWRSSDLWDALRKTRPKVTKATTLTIVATTAGEGLGFGHDEYKAAKEIASGKVKNPHFLPIIYEAEKKDDWRDEEVWKRCNFALGSFKSLRAMRIEALEADVSIRKRRKFQRYHLNRWIEGADDPWIEISVYDLGNRPFTIDDVKHLPCFIGVDASAVSDLTAIVLVFHDAENRMFYAIPHIWCPAASIARRSDEDGVPYEQWQAEQFLNSTDGASVDEAVIEKKLKDLYDDPELDVRLMGFDPWYIAKMIGRLRDEGLPVVTIPQRYSHMSPAMKETEKAVIDGRFIHGGHPVLRWCFANVPVPIPNDQGDIKPSKKDPIRKIDGAVASMIGIYLATVAENNPFLSLEAMFGHQETSANG
jgi:phage terminase large subunit-like protein